MFENLFPYEFYEPSHGQSNDGYPWRLPTGHGSGAFREPGYSTRYVKPGRQQRPHTSVPTSNYRARGMGKETDRVPVVKSKTKSIPVTDGIRVRDSLHHNTKTSPRVVSVSRRVENLKMTAATRIQSAFRGYCVRKFTPLKHLRTIHKVQEELKELVRKMIEMEQFEKLCNDAQERLKWTEGVMALLLRLDSIQGAHPDVREVRKSVAKELIHLQEILDSTADDRHSHHKIKVKESNGNRLETKGEMPLRSDGENKVHEIRIKLDAPALASRVMTEEELSNNEVRPEEIHEDLHIKNSVSLPSNSLEHSKIADGGLVVSIGDVGDFDNDPQATKNVSIPQDQSTELKSPDEQLEATASLSTSPHLIANDAMSPESSKLDLEDIYKLDDLPVEIEDKDRSQFPLVSPESEEERAEVITEEGKFELLEPNERNEHRPEYNNPDGEVLTCSGQDDAVHKLEDEGLSAAILSSVEGAMGGIEEDRMRMTNLVIEGGEIPSMENTMEQVVVEDELKQINRQPREVEDRVMSLVERNTSTTTLPDHSQELQEQEQPDILTTPFRNDQEEGKMAANTAIVGGEQPDILTTPFRNDQEEGKMAANTAIVGGASSALSECCTLDQLGRNLCQVTSQAEPSGSGDDGLPMTDLQTMQQIIEENRKLKAVIAEVLQWGKQQNDIIHNLATRIEHLEASATLMKVTLDSKNRIKSGIDRNGRWEDTKRICYPDNQHWPSSSAAATES